MASKLRWDCDNEECHNDEWLTFDEYSKICREYNKKYLCPSCREKRDNEYKKFKNDMEELFKSNAKLTSEPKAEYTLDLHWLSQRNEELLKEIEELKKENERLKEHNDYCMEKYWNDEAERLQVVNDIYWNEILRLRGNKNGNKD